jgi:hypothetical protein
LLRNIDKEFPDPLWDLALQHIAPVLGRPDQVGEGIVDGMGVRRRTMPPLYPLKLSLAADSMSAAKDTHSPPPQAAGQPERFSHKERGMQVPIWIGTSHMAGKGLFAGQDITLETIMIRSGVPRLPKPNAPTRWRQGMPLCARSTIATPLMAIRDKTPPVIAIIPAIPPGCCRPRAGLWRSSLYAIYGQGQSGHISITQAVEVSHWFDQ